MNTVLALVLLFATPLLAEPKLPPSTAIAEFAADPIPANAGKHFKDFRIERADLNKILETYFTGEQGGVADRYSHVAGGDRTGTITLRDGTVLKWVVRPAGLATITFPDSGVLYLVKEKPDPG